MSRGKLISVKETNKNRFKVATIDKDDPKSFYVNISSWVEPTVEIDASKSLYKLRKQLETIVTKSPLTKTHFLDLDLRESGLRKGKRSFMSCEITFLDNDKDLTSNELTTELERLQDNIYKHIFTKHKEFNFHPKK